MIAVISCPAMLRHPAVLDRLRGWCADHAGIFHYEIDGAEGLAQAMVTVAQVRPRVVVVNGGDQLVRAALTELAVARPFGDTPPPPLAVLPDAPSDLIALNLTRLADPVAALARIAVLVSGGDLAAHVESRALIALRPGAQSARPVMGMFLGGADLAEAIIWCRKRLYPLGLPDRIAHGLALLALVVSRALGLSARIFPPRGGPMSISLTPGDGAAGTDRREGGGRREACAILFVTTLDRMLFGCRAIKGRGLRLMAVERGPLAMLRLVGQSLVGRLGRTTARGVHVAQGDVVRIEGRDARVLLDGQLFIANEDSPIWLSTSAPVRFLKVAA